MGYQWDEGKLLMSRRGGGKAENVKIPHAVVKTRLALMQQSQQTTLKEKSLQHYHLSKAQQIPILQLQVTFPSKPELMIVAESLDGKVSKLRSPLFSLPAFLFLVA